MVSKSEEVTLFCWRSSHSNLWIFLSLELCIFGVCLNRSLIKNPTGQHIYREDDRKVDLCETLGESFWSRKIPHKEAFHSLGERSSHFSISQVLLMSNWRDNNWNLQDQNSCTVRLCQWSHFHPWSDSLNIECVLKLLWWTQNSEP